MVIDPDYHTKVVDEITKQNVFKFSQIEQRILLDRYRAIQMVKYEIYLSNQVERNSLLYIELK